ncbi:MAG: hypothetical protein SOH81_00475 [Acetobacter sp.]|jgi:hypothetical protein
MEDTMIGMNLAEIVFQLPVSSLIGEVEGSKNSSREVDCSDHSGDQRQRSGVACFRLLPIIIGTMES